MTDLTKELIRRWRWWYLYLIVHALLLAPTQWVEATQRGDGDATGILSPFFPALMLMMAVVPKRQETLRGLLALPVSTRMLSGSVAAALVWVPLLLVVSAFSLALGIIGVFRETSLWVYRDFLIFCISGGVAYCSVFCLLVTANLQRRRTLDSGIANRGFLQSILQFFIVVYVVVGVVFGLAVPKSVEELGSLKLAPFLIALVAPFWVGPCVRAWLFDGPIRPRKPRSEALSASRSHETERKPWSDPHPWGADKAALTRSRFAAIIPWGLFAALVIVLPAIDQIPPVSRNAFLEMLIQYKPMITNAALFIPFILAQIFMLGSYGKLGPKWAAPLSRRRIVFDAWLPVGAFLGFVAIALSLRQWMEIPAHESIVLAFQSILAPVCAIGALMLIQRGAALQSAFGAVMAVAMTATLLGAIAGESRVEYPFLWGAFLLGAAFSIVAYRAQFSILTSNSPRALLNVDGARL